LNIAVSKGNVVRSTEQTVRRFFRPFLPIGLLELVARRDHEWKEKYENERRAKFERLRHKVAESVAAIAALTATQCRDAAFLENEFIPALGLNDETLCEQPQELARYLGTGLHIWQYPSQLARYLAWISVNAQNIKSYMEIGCRWGGLVILVTEWLCKNGAPLEDVVAIDPIEQTPFIEEYFQLLQNKSSGRKAAIRSIYLREYSTSDAVARLVEELKPEFVFIDGDHTFKVAFSDHMLARKYAKIVVHHDISSQSCPDISFLWNALKELEYSEFEFSEFVDQYPSLVGRFLGIGAMKRRTNASQHI
jgi:cephalosporin hydroxylase